MLRNVLEQIRYPSDHPDYFQGGLAIGCKLITLYEPDRNWWRQEKAGALVLVLKPDLSEADLNFRPMVKVLFETQIFYTDPTLLFSVDEPWTNLLEGKSYCISGKLVWSRDFYKDLIKFSGGVYKKALSRNVDFLVRGFDAHSNKLTKASKYGVTVMPELDFYRTLFL